MSAAPRRALRVGLALAGPADARSWEQALALARWADDAGIDSLWLPESHFRAGATASPLVALAAVAARTRRLRLGTTSLLISVHEPLRLAADVATLDQLSGGRVVLGVGRGYDPVLFQGFGIDARAKRDRFDAALDGMLAAWCGEPPGLPRPLQLPHPPLVVAAFGRRGLEQAARRGLPYLASPLETLAQLVQNHAWHRAALPAEVDPASLAVPVLRSVHVAASAAEARRAREALAREITRLAARAAASALAGRAAGAVGERALVGEAPVVAEGLAAYRERLGLDLLVVRPAPGTDDAERRASLRRLLEQVLPQVA